MQTKNQFLVTLEYNKIFHHTSEKLPIFTHGNLQSLSCQWQWSFSIFQNPVHELKSGVHLPTKNTHRNTVLFGTESITNLDAELWNMVLEDKNSSKSLNVFKSNIKYWTLNHCPCRISKTCIGQAGLIKLFLLFSPPYVYLFSEDIIFKKLF